MYASDRPERRRLKTANVEGAYELSSSDSNLCNARKSFIRDERARNVAHHLKESMHKRMKHYYEPAKRFDVQYILGGDRKEQADETNMRYRKSQQAVLLHCAALFDVRECDMSWLPAVPTERGMSSCCVT